MARAYVSPVRAEKVETTRQRIVDVVVELLSAGDTTWSVQDVADRAGVSARTVYRHFATRDELVDGVVEWINDVILQGRPSPDLRNLDDLVDAAPLAFGFIEEHMELYRALLFTGLGRRAHHRGRSRRDTELRTALAEELEGLAPDAQIRLLAMTHLLASSDAVMFLKDYWDLDAATAARSISWAIRALGAAARDPEWREEL